MKIELDKSKVNQTKKTLIILIILFLAFLYLNYNFNFYIPCIFHKITNLWCPGCGLTRMILSIIKLDFYQAFRYNPLLFILSPLFIIYGIIYFIKWLQNKKIIIPKSILIILLIITIIFMILRNIPYFDFLAPTKIK